MLTVKYTVVSVVLAMGMACDQGPPPLANVSGIVTFQGVPPGTLMPGAIPVAGATISAQDKKTETNADGSFHLTGLPIGEADLTFSAEGYADTTVRASLSEGDNVRSIVVRPRPEVVVGDTQLLMSAPGVVATSLYLRIKTGALADDPMPTFTTTGPFKAERAGTDYRARSVRITATGPGSGTVTVSYDGSSKTIDVDARALRFKTINIGSANACAIALDDTAWCWGGNNSGQVGASTPYQCNGGACQYGGRDAAESPLPVTGGMQFAQIATMGVACAYFGPVGTCGTSCALTTDGQPWCWGGTPKKMATVSLKQLALRGGGPNGAVASCGLDLGGKVQCFASTGKSPDGGDMTFQSYSTARSHSCGVDTAGDVYCWGGNTKGELGIGTMDSESHTTPVRVSASAKFSGVSLGESSTCALATTGAIYCWGVGFTSGGDSPPPACTGSTQVCQVTPRVLTRSRTYVAMSRGRAPLACGLTAAGAVDCWDFYNVSPSSPDVPPLAIISVGNASTGYGGPGLSFHACGLTADGVAYCWRDSSILKIAQP